MAVEDFTTYTFVKEGAGTDVTLTSTRITLDGVQDRNSNNYVYDNKGAAHFGNLTHLFTIFMDGAYYSDAWTEMWGVTNTEGNYYEQETAGNGFVVQQEGSNCDLTIYNLENQGIYDTIALEEAVIYYMKVNRTGTTGTLYAYSDAARTSLVDSVAITVPNTTYQYIYAFATYDDGTAGRQVWGYVENLDLQESAPPSYTGQLMMVT